MSLNVRSATCDTGLRKPLAKLQTMKLSERINVALSISTKAKLKLSAVKLRLRQAGLAPKDASESAIVDRLVHAASFNDVLALFR